MNKARLLILLALSSLALVSCGESESQSLSSNKSEDTSSINSSDSSSKQESSSEVSLLSSSSEDSSCTESSIASSDESGLSSETSSPFETTEGSSEISSSEESSSVESSSEASSLPLDPATLYDGYYASLVSWTDGEDLKQQLHDIISGGDYNPISYAGSSTNWFSNQNADQDLYDHEFLDAVYADSPIRKEATQTSWQREHAWCASLMTGSLTADAVKTLGRATDFHNLFASFSSGNSSRGNKNFGIADKTASTYASVGGAGGYSYDAKNFEPGDYDKGRLSRAVFYMATMYGEDELDERNNILMKGLTIVEDYVDYVQGDDCAFAIGNLSTLLEWSKLPVDALEYQHNESVYSFVPSSSDHAQGNRNPYIDFPGLIDYVYGEKKDEGGELKDLYSSYETLCVGEEGVRHYAISSAKRQYDEDEPFHASDVHVVAVNNDFSESVYAAFEVEGAEEGKAFLTEASTVTIKTPINDIAYAVKVETDPIASATWSHSLTGRTGDFKGINENAGEANEMALSGLAWNVYWEEGIVDSTSAKLGAKFGKNADNPVKSAYFETKSAFSYGGKSLVNGIYLEGAPSSKETFDVKFYVAGDLVGTKTVAYIDASTTQTVGVSLPSPKAGKVRIEISNANKPIYIKNLAIHAEVA